MPRKSKVKVLLVVLGLVVVLCAAFYAGDLFGVGRKSITISDSRSIINADFSLFWNAMQLVKDKYVNIADVKDQDLVYGAIKGAVGALGDPYTTFFPPTDAQKFQEDLTGSFGGIGAEIGEKNNQIVIIAPLKGNAAEAAGLKAGDMILKINDTVTTDMAVEDAVTLIRGPEGSTVTLLIYRDGWKDPQSIKVTRGVVSVPTLDWEMKPGNIAVFHLYNFDANAAQLFYNASLDALSKGARGVVLDLRNNPGGYLDVANELAGWFVKRGEVVVQEKFRSGETTTFRATGNEAFVGFPTVVLVNGGSASAAEILAGALRDDSGVKLVGEKTFGKGSVQELQALSDGSTLKVTIAKWLTPNGDEIDKKGLDPDVVATSSDADALANRDPVLDKALQMVGAQLH